MITSFLLFAGIALLTAGTTGWLLAARSARRMQLALRDSLARCEQRAIAAEARAEDIERRRASVETELAFARDAAQAAQRDLAIAHADQAALRAEAQAMKAALTAEVARLRERLSFDHERGRARENRAVEEVQRVLAPLMERERMHAELAKLEIGRGTRGELPRLMDAISRIGNFSSVVLSDEVGLPLASTRSEDGELLAGLWSILFTVADRIATSGEPTPIAIVVHDAANQTILHRLFSAVGSRFLLTAVCRGRSLPPEALDPALDKLERVLAGSALVAS